MSNYNYTKSNPYFSKDDQDFVSTIDRKVDPERMKRIKANNRFILSVLQIITLKEDFFNTPGMQKYWDRVIIAGNLANSDKLTGFNTKNLGEKIKFLVKTLAKSPEKLDAFKNSFFVKKVIEPIYIGDFSFASSDLSPSLNKSVKNDRWEYYEKIGNDPDLKGSQLNCALKCYTDDPTVPVGLNFANLINCVVREDEYGNYQFVTEMTDEMQDDAIKASKEFIELLKSIDRFKNNFKNPNLIESEMVDE